MVEIQPIRVEIEREDDGRILASIPDLPGVMAYGRTEDEAIEQAQTQVALMKPQSANWFILTHGRDRGAIIQVSWSPDGSKIYCDRLTDVPLGVYSVPVLGGEKHLVLENAGSPEALPDGSLLINRVNARRQLQLYRFWPETGRLQDYPLESPGISFIGAACSRVSPGARETITFASPIGPKGPGLGLYAIDLASNAIRRLALPVREAGQLQGWTVTRDGKSVLAALPAGSITRVVAIPVKGQAVRRTLFTVANIVWFMDAADENSVAVNLADRPEELVRLLPGGGAPERIAAFPLSANPAQLPSCSPTVEPWRPPTFPARRA